MIIEMVRQIIAVEVVDVFAENVYDGGVTPAEIKSAEFDFFSFV